MANRRKFSLATVLVAALAPVLLATGCSSDDGTTTPQAQSLGVADQWVKAADNGMTAAFAVLTNDSDTDIRVVSASSPVAGKTELHEIVPDAGAAVMREKKDGYLIPANGSLELKPGADHIMLMDLKQPIKAGDSVEIELRMADGSTQKVDALARDFSGNQEDYHQ
ncbi:hypothetical protein C6V83_05705 [Gordonia iterans]|uniref:Copper chaperone PCu(A)C n=1 Tax=Gordonia iterans TaxID=1004901 RepID=A0A2S0KDS1_9ACTN|nr:copper chaperone PCu(A)C [Gordonia iterans]AVL99847.1 hypothetical protein C6V83_05705 [Gordonia iterans]